MVAAAQVPVRMSVAEFLAWNPGDGQARQLVDGEPQAMAPASRTHGTLQGELGRLIGNHLASQATPCSLVVTSGVVPHVQASHNMRVPDLAVTCSDYAAEEAGLTDPVLIVEILSPGNQAETWANVWAYTTIPSVREILVLRTVSVGADLLRRRPRWKLAAGAGEPYGQRSGAGEHRAPHLAGGHLPEHAAATPTWDLEDANYRAALHPADAQHEPGDVGHAALDRQLDHAFTGPASGGAPLRVGVFGD